MQLQPKFCPCCGGATETRTINEHAQPFCPTCDAPVFVNPPPLAACLVLNPRREVLLVKRVRGEGQAGWSLPLGFIYPSESVSDAAQRILQAQTGLESRPVRLIDASTAVCQDRGDLFIVTLEMERTGGQEQPGPNVETLAYHPHSRHPRLAFTANERAIQMCAESHQEEWLIRDSFERLEANEDRAMLSDVLVDIIHRDSAAIVHGWLEDVRQNATTPSYAKTDSMLLQERVDTALSQFGRWLGGKSADRELADFYREMGRSRRAEGFRNQEILSALMLLKKHIWQHAWEQGIGRRPIDAYRILELNRRIVIFFDKAMYHMTRGFESGASG